jgi:hypothetical protein
MLKKVSMTFLLRPFGSEDKHLGGDAVFRWILDKPTHHPSQIRQMADFSRQRIADHTSGCGGSARK